MPNMADITVKKADGTTNITYVKKTPSSGDRVAATWTADAVSAVHAHRPSLSMVTRASGNATKPGRNINIQFKMPITEVINGIPTVLANVPFTFSGVVPTNVDSVKVGEAVAQSTNLLVSALVQACINEGYAAS